jgi:tight adherence protein B
VAVTPAVTMLGLAATLAVGLAGVGLIVKEGRARAQRERRTALQVVERRAARPDSRLEARLRRTELGRLIADRLAGGGLSWRVVDFLAINLLAGLGTFLILDQILPSLFALVFGAAAVRGCWAYLDRARSRRRDAFVAQLPEVARVISNATAAGLSLAAALDLAEDELDEPAAGELGRIAQELRLGQSLDRALDNLLQRVPSRDVGVLVSTLVIQQRSGGDVVAALRDIADTLVARKDLSREVKTVMAGAVYTSYLVVILGVGILFLVNMISPGALELMTGTGLGRIALIVGGGLFAIGQFLIRRIVRIDT